MAKTISNLIYDKSTRFKQTLMTVAADDSYPTGGYPLSAADCGLTEIVNVIATVDGVGTHFGVFDYTNSKLMVFVAAGTQVAGSADINALRFRLRVTGY